MATKSASTLKNLHRLKIVNIPWTIADAQLKQYFSQFGYISNAKVLFDRNTGMSRGSGYINVNDKETCENILNKRNHHLEGAELYIRQWIE